MVDGSFMIGFSPVVAFSERDIPGEEPVPLPGMFAHKHVVQWKCGIWQNFVYLTQKGTCHDKEYHDCFMFYH